MSESTPETLAGRTFSDRDLKGARFSGCDLSDVVVRGSFVGGVEIDSPWLCENGDTLTVNGVDVVGFVDAELDRRFPGRSLRRAETPEGLRDAWSAVERAWEAMTDRVSDLPDHVADSSVDGEWSFAETLRHLIMATDTWLGRAVLELEQPFHPAGLPHDDDDTEAYDPGVFSEPSPAFETVLAVRADRQGMVRSFLATVTPEGLAEPRRNPHAPRHGETVLSCIRTILDEEWEHLRYATRDLDALSRERIHMA